MLIAVNAIFLQKGKMEGYGWFVQEVFSRLATQYPAHQFLFVFDRPYDESFVFAPNCKAIVVGPPARHPGNFFYWYNIAAPAALRKYKPDVWVNPYGFCSTTTSIPQLLMVHDLAYLHYPKFIAWHQYWYYKLFTPRFIKKAKQVLTVSDFSKADIEKNFPSAVNEINTVYPAARAGFQPLSWEEKNQVKDSFSDGREYFLFVGGIHPRKNLLNLLKAFSLFKKWQKSNMKLLVAGRMAWQYEDLLEKIKTYKYREDLVLLGALEEAQLTRITASAYALVYPSFFEGFGMPILEAMQSGVPVIASNTSSMPEVGADAALYADPNDPDAIAKQMLLLYKDEKLRNFQIEKGLERAQDFSWDKTAQGVWEIILAIAK
ncbi:MAG: glycosyltransferase [Chitinophagaceae bacterium BSSC1]|nr:MAG: glycosyltransferase [Chitinophagaceae bacterium BSSC1]